MRLITEGLEALAVESAVVREMDATSIGEYGIPGAVLMESAGSAAAAVAASMLGTGASAVILAGAGNNAGDGFVIARLLANRGVPVQIITAVARNRYTGDAALNLHIAEKMALPIAPWTGCEDAQLPAAGLVIDALLGTGLSGPLRGPFGEIIRCVNASGARVLAVDVPSGLDGDTGEAGAAAVRASKTVTFALPKKGLFIGAGPALSGEVVLADIGIPRDAYPQGKAIDKR